MAEQSTAIVGASSGSAGTVQRQEFGASQLEVVAETAGAVLAAQARAMVEARFVMALRRPRDWDDVRSRMLRACERPGFAGSATDKIWGAAWYRKPVGDGVEGFSVRFAEEAVRAMCNIDVQAVTVYDDERKRIVTVTVTDLEGNIAYPTSITVEKTVERKYLKKGEEALRVRVNSEGKPTYIVWATDDEVFSKQQNLISKALRNGVLRLLPGDIQAECRERILAIRNGDLAKDPDKARRTIADGFAKLNILPSHLKDYLGHDLLTSTPAELAGLRDLWEALKAGKLTWPEVMDAVRAERDEDPTPTPTAKRAGLDGVADELEKKKAPGEAPTIAAAAAAAAAAAGAGTANVPPQPPQGAPGSSCPDHEPLTVVNPDGSRACDFDGCKWTAPAPPPAASKGRRGGLQE